MSRPHVCLVITRSLPLLLLVACAAARPALAADAAAPTAGLAAQERARTLATQLIRGVIDGQLRQLEENGLGDRPIHADIRALRGAIDSLVQREMQEVIDLLGQADAAAPADRRALIDSARTRARAIVTRLAAERQQVIRRLKEATLVAEARSVLERQSRLLATTESLPTLPDGRREQVMLAAIEEERNVKTLLATLQASLADVSNWGGETGATAVAGLRELEQKNVAAAVAAAEARLAAADPAAAATEQRRAIAGLESVLAAVEGNQAAQRVDVAAAGKEAAALAGKAAAMRAEMAKVPLTDESVEKLLAEQSALQESLAKLAEQARGEPAVAGLVEKAKEASTEAAAGLLEGDQKRALANQDVVIDTLEKVADRLEAGKPAAASAEEFARRAAELMKVLESVNALSKRQDDISRAAAAQPQVAVEAERQLAAQVAKLLDETQSPAKQELPTAVEQRLERAAEAAANSAQAQSPQAAQSALQAATEAMQSAARELANAVADARWAELAAKTGELSRAAEVAERAAATERSIAEAAKQAAAPQAKQEARQANAAASESARESASDLAAKQAEVAAVTDKMKDAVDGLSPEAAKMIEAARADMKTAEDLLAARADGDEKMAGTNTGDKPADEPADKTAANLAAQAAKQTAAESTAKAAAEAAAKAAEQAADSLAKAAATMREDAKKAADELARTAAAQAAAAAQEKRAAEQAAATQSPTAPPQKQAEALAARETALARDELVAKEIASAVEEQSKAREAVAATAEQLEQLLAEPSSNAAADSAATADREAAAAALAKAKEEFADAQRAVGERVAAALDQQEIGNQPLREALEQASRQEDLGTGFVPESPETTADMIAGEKATAAAEEMLAAADGQQQRQQSSESQPGDDQSNSQARSENSRGETSQGEDAQNQDSQGESSESKNSQAKNSQRESSQSKTAQDEKSQSRGSRTGEARDEQPLREIDNVDKKANAGSRAGDTDITDKSFERDAWFAKLPPEVRKAIRAGSQRRAPRGYEEKMDRYFKNLE